MSHLKNNVNPNHYKEAGRTRPGDDVPHSRNKRALTQARSRYRKRATVMTPKPTSLANGRSMVEDMASTPEEQDITAHSHE